MYSFITIMLWFVALVFLLFLTTPINYHRRIDDLSNQAKSIEERLDKLLKRQNDEMEERLLEHRLKRDRSTPKGEIHEG